MWVKPHVAIRVLTCMWSEDLGAHRRAVPMLALSSPHIVNYNMPSLKWAPGIKDDCMPQPPVNGAISK